MTHDCIVFQMLNGQKMGFIDVRFKNILNSILDFASEIQCRAAAY